MPNDDLEVTKKKLAQLENVLDALIQKTFAYCSTILHILEDRGLAEPSEVIPILKGYHKQFDEAARNGEFFKLMGQFEEDDSYPPDPGV